MKNSIKKIIAEILIVAMILSSHGFYTLAGGVDSNVESSEKATVVDDEAKLNDDDFGSAPTSTKSDLEEDEEEASEDGNVDEPEEDIEETTTEEESTSEEESTTEEESTSEEESTTEEETTTVEETITEKINESSVDESTVSSSKEIEVPELSSKSEVNTIDGEEFGVSNQTVYLDFGANRPSIDKTSNWTSVTLPSAGDNVFSFTGVQGTSIYDKFASESYSSNLGAITENYGSGNHIKLPTFDNSIWYGFTFDGWYYAGDKVTDTCFPYSFLYDAERRYTAQWNRDTNQTKKVDIRYYRATYSSVWNGGTSTTIEKHEILTAYSQNKKVGSYIQKDASEILGYKISEVKIYVKDSTDTSRTELGRNGLKVVGPDGNYITFDSEDLIMNADYGIEGKVPNHDVYIEFYYVPDTSDKHTVTIYHNDTNGNGLNPPGVIVNSHAAEEIVVYDPRVIPGYVFKEGQVVDTTANPNRGIFKLGDMKVDGQKYTTDQINEDNNGDGKKDGHFKAVMPNQNVIITYYYELGGSEAPFYIETRKEKADGTYNISTVSDILTLGSANHKRIAVPNYTNEGYVLVPDTAFQNINTVNYVQPTGTSAGEIEFYVDTTNKPVITLIYNYDYTSSYWTKLGFKSGDHGTIQASPGSKSFSDRYIKRNGTYDLATLTANITVTPEDGYMCKWYKSNVAGDGPEGDPLPSTGIQVTGSNFNLFASFVEDPSKWIDVSFVASEHSRISGTTSFHIRKPSPLTAVTFPNVEVDEGYHHEQRTDAVGGYVWLDTNGNPLETQFTQTMTYRPYIVANFAGSDDAVKPVLHLTYNANGTAKANLFGTYGNRKYVLADSNDKVIKVCSAAQSINGFDNLIPGTTYHMYESKNDVAVGSQIATSLPNVSEKYVFGVKALRDAPTVTPNSDDTYSITFTPGAGASYALLDDRYNVVNNWGSAQSFTGLTKGTYYLIVAKDSANASLSANDDDVIRNGYVVYTSCNDLTGRKYRLTFLGTGNVAAGSTGRALPAGGYVYEVEAGKNVRITGANGFTTFVMSNNVVINTSASARSPYESQSTSITFAMPEQDVIINRIQLPNTVTVGTNQVTNTIEINSNGANLSLNELGDIRDRLNEDPTIANAINDACEVKHYIEVNEYASRKTSIQGLADGVISPYEYTFDVQSVVLGIPYRASTIGGIAFEGYLAFDKEMLGNSEYKEEDGSGIACPYAPAQDDEVGTAIFNMNVDAFKGINYIKKHKVKVESNVTSGGIEFNQEMEVVDSKLISTATNYSDLQNRLKDLWDNASTDANKKEYKFNGLFDGDTKFAYETKKINRAKNLTIKYTLNQEREDAKTALSAEIVSAVGKLGTLTNAAVIETLNNAITAARDIRNAQNTKTVEQLKTAKTTLETAKNAAKDPALPGETVTVTINANGGTVNSNAINVITGEDVKFEALATIEATRSEYAFVSWNTKNDGTGNNVTSETIVGLDPPTTLYAIWEKKAAPGPKPRPVPRGGGGGGGGGGGHVREEIITDKQYAVMPQVSIDQLMSGGYTVQVPVNLNAAFMEENAATGFYSIFDPVTNQLSVKLGDKTNKTCVKDRWIELHIANGYKRLYRTNANGDLITGKFLDSDGQMYYLSNTSDINYGMLEIGWVKDPMNGNWYYSNPQTGALSTGWQKIDGKYYYFYNPVTDNNAATIDVNAFVSQYGMMMSNMTLDSNETLGDTGALVTPTPYVAQ